MGNVKASHVLMELVLVTSLCVMDTVSVKKTVVMRRSAIVEVFFSVTTVNV